MAATIKIKNSSTASAVPTSSDLVQGELAVNVTDKRIFTENASGTVVELGTNPSILTLPDGSASAPTLTNDGDTNTGIFFPAADTVGITTGGTERARVDSSGNLGLGTTSPSERLHVVGKIAVSGTNPSIRQTVQNAYLDLCGGTTVGTDPSIQIAGSTTTSDANIVFYNSNTHIFRNSAGSSERMRLDASGNLGVGTTSPSYELDVEARSGDCEVAITGAGTNNAVLKFENVTSGTLCDIYGDNSKNMIFRTNGTTERARIDSSGNLLVGTTSNVNSAHRLVVQTASDNQIAVNATTTSGNVYSTINFTQAGATKGQIFQDHANTRFYAISNNTGGVYLAAGGTSWTSASDERVKDIIEPIENATEKLKNWRTVVGKYKTDEEGTRRSFLIAQDVLSTFPEAVDTGDEDEYGIRYQDTIPLLVKSIQEQQAIIETLTARITALEKA